MWGAMLMPFRLYGSRAWFGQALAVEGPGRTHVGLGHQENQTNIFDKLRHYWDNKDVPFLASEYL